MPMLLAIRCNLGLFLLLSLLPAGASVFRRVCYFTNWSRDLQEAGARFRLTDVEPHLCTHLLYAFAAVQRHNNNNSDSLVPIATQKTEGREEELQRYHQFNALKKVHGQLKTLLSVGGSIQTNGDFVQIVSSESSRKHFAQNAVRHLREWGFDGLDIDWEYPGSPPDTKAKFVLFLKELRQTFQAEAESRKVASLLLSVAAPTSQDQISAGYDVPQVSSLVDFVNLMAYDFHGSWNRVTSFNSPLYARAGDPRFSPKLSVNWAVQTWLKKGAHAEKLVLGIAGYGQSFTLQESGQHGVGAPTNGSGSPGPWRHMSGQLAYYEVCEYIKAGGEEVWDDLQCVPYVYLGNQWVGYDNPRSIKEKVSFAIQRSLGGVMLWTLDMDDFRGAFCGKGRYPLLSAMVRAIGEQVPGGVTLRDAVTWAHPTAANGSTSTTRVVPISSSVRPSASTLLTTPPVVTPPPSTRPGVSFTRHQILSSTAVPSANSTAVPSANSTQKCVVLIGKNSRAASRASCRVGLLLASAFVLLCLFVY
ncbi:chitotriosidase-1-like [Babylonia areolata]|uniref:chitotriosidase-1-like n=1 Tax=Babylonia areolata TaxID=304850 RepID=UPI003FD42468